MLEITRHKSVWAAATGTEMRVTLDGVKRLLASSASLIIFGVVAGGLLVELRQHLSRMSYRSADSGIAMRQLATKSLRALDQVVLVAKLTGADTRKSVETQRSLRSRISLTQDDVALNEPVDRVLSLIIETCRQIESHSAGDRITSEATALPAPSPTAEQHSAFREQEAHRSNAGTDYSSLALVLSVLALVISLTAFVQTRSAIRQALTDAGLL